MLGASKEKLTLTRFNQQNVMPFEITTENANLITAIAATIIAGIAMSVSIWQGYLSRKHNNLSVEPILHFTSGTLPNKDKNVFTYTISVGNAGLGPAIVESIRIYYKDEYISEDKYKIHQSSLLSLAADMATYKEGVRREINGKTIGEFAVILPNNFIELLSFEFIEEDAIKRENITTKLYDIDVRIKYSSVYKNELKKIQLISTKKGLYPPLIKENISKIREIYPNI